MGTYLLKEIENIVKIKKNGFKIHKSNTNQNDNKSFEKQENI